MMNNINNNSYGRNIYGQEEINNLNENKQVQNIATGENNLSQQPKNLLENLEKLQKVEVENLLKNMQEEIKNAQLIAIKIVKGEKTTQNELNFLKSKYPDMKQIAEMSIKECNNLKKILKYCKTNQEAEKLISKAMNDIANMIKNGTLSEVQAKIKTSALDEVVKFSKKLEKEFDKAKSIAIKIIKGEKLTSSEEKLIKEKYPDLKKIVNQSVKESNELKIKLKNCNTEEQRQQVISKVIKYIEDKGKDGTFSKTEVKLKILAIEEAINFSKKDQAQLKKAELIAIKIIKEENLTSSQKKFINENYPQLKQVIQDSVKEYNPLKEVLQNLNSNQEKNQLLNNEINKLEYMLNKGDLSDIHATIKRAIIEEMKESEKEKIDRKDEKKFLFYLNTYIYLFNSGLIGKSSIGIIVVVILSIIYLKLC